jgi:hypothetical protein
MKIEIKELFNMDWERGNEISLDRHRKVSINVHIGPSDSEISENFTIYICDLAFVKRELIDKGIFQGKWTYVVQDTSKQEIYNFVNEYISEMHYERWRDYSDKLRLFGQSEYEDYNRNYS